MAIIETQYTAKGFRSEESDPRADITLLVGPYHDSALANPDLIAEAVRDHIATLPGIVSVQVKKATTDVVETTVAPL